MTGSPRRIHIIGGPGSGKTTLARSLAARLGVPARDLDAVGYEGGAGPRRPLAMRLRDIDACIAAPGWVAEGIFLWWSDDLLRAADLIIWLDLPWMVVAWRIIVRHARASLAGTNAHRGLRKLATFVWWTRGYYYGAVRTPRDACDDGATTRAATARRLASPDLAGKVRYCRRPAAVAALLAGLA